MGGSGKHGKELDRKYENEDWYKGSPYVFKMDPSWAKEDDENSLA